MILGSSKDTSISWINNNFDVKSFFKTVGLSSGKTFELGQREILTYAWQTAKGMNYLSGMKVS